MRQWKHAIGVALCIMLCFCSFTLAQAGSADVESAPLRRSTAAQNGMVRVYLSSMGTVTKLNLTVIGSYVADGAQDVSLSNGASVVIQFNTNTGRITMTTGGKDYDMGSELALRRRQTSGQSGLKIAQSRKPSNLYPGDLHLIAQKSGSMYKLYPVVHVYMEYYLYGVVPYEMGNSAPLEALKAQAVAARTYTLRKMQARKSYIYDVTDTTSDQVYNGNSDSTTNCTSAVDTTKGVVLMNGSTLTGTYYTASNGGQTESAKNAWGSTGYDYLTVKDDPFDRQNSASTVRSAIIYADNTSSAQKSALVTLLNSKAGGTVTQIHGISLHTPKYAVPSRVYTKMNFDVTASGTRRIITCDVFSELESILGLSINSSQNELWSVVQSGSNFRIEARRYGHGIGMSQRGAMQMASLGYTYDQILGFYYENCTRVQYTFTHTILSSVENEGSTIITENPADITAGSAQATVSMSGSNDRLALRMTASSDGKVLTSLISGTSVNVLAAGKEWTLVRLGSLVGYMPTGSLRMPENPPTSSAEQPTQISQWATVVSSGTLNLRKEASASSSVIATIPDGTVLCVFSVANGWAKVQYGAAVGYASTDFLRLSDSYTGSVTVYPTGTAWVSVKNGSTVNLRAKASTASQKLAVLDQGTQVSVHSNDGTWCKVTANNTDGYIMVEFLSFSQSPAQTTPTPADSPQLGSGEVEAVVQSDASTLNLRAQPSMQAQILLEIPRGESVVVTSRGSEWCSVRYAGVNGYSMTKYLYFPQDKQETTVVAYATVDTPGGSLNLRSQAKAGSMIIAQIPQYGKIAVLEKGTSWCKVRYQQQTGYVMTSYLRMEDEAQRTPEPTATATVTVTSTPTATVTATPTATPTLTPAPVQLPDGQYIAFVTTASGSLNLRQSPTARARVLTTIPQNAEIRVWNLADGWWETAYNGYNGYVMAKFLTVQNQPTTTSTPTASPTVTATPAPEDADPNSSYATVDTGGGHLNLRQSANGKIIGTIPNGARVEILSYDDIWCKVSHNNQQGYAMTKFLYLHGISALPETIATPKPTTASDVRYVNTDDGGLNLREEANSNSSVIVVIPRGKKVRLIEAGSTWCRVTYGDNVGYVMTSFLSEKAPAATKAPDAAATASPTATPAPAVTEKPVYDPSLMETEGRVRARVSVENGGLNMRKWCATSAPLITTLSNGEMVQLLMLGDEWSLINYEGLEGYCKTEFLILVDAP